MRTIHVLAASIALTTCTITSAAHAGNAHTEGCTGGPTSKYEFSSVTKSSRPTSVKSAYITGPGTLSYSKTISANVSAAMTASVSAEAGVVFAKASTSLGTTVTAGRTWTDGFSYSLTVPAGQKRAMQLFQESRSFVATKYVLDAQRCEYVRKYNDPTNAPLSARNDEWKLVS